MKFTKLISNIAAGLLLFSCSETSGPVIGDGVPDQFIGSVGTNRTYRTVERWLVPGTDEPYYSVPDSLQPKLSIDSAHLAQGVCRIITNVETVTEIEDEFYTSWKLSSPRGFYRQVKCDGTVYDLSDALAILQSGASYSPTRIVIGPTIYKETVDAMMAVLPEQGSDTSPATTYIKKTLRVGDSWVRHRWLDTTQAHMRIETIVEVVGLVTVTVSSGSYSAYQLHLATTHFNPDYTFDEGFEYFVPNIGLVLKESDMHLFQWNSLTNQTVAFRQIVRQELLECDFVQ